MRPTRLFTLPVTISTVTDAGADDEYGNPTETTTTTIVWGELQQQSRNEEGGGRHVLEGVYRLFVEPGASVVGWDRVTIGGVDYEVDGPPWQVRNPRTGTISHVEATLRRAR